jgi:transcription elongation factor Elf1
VVPSKLAVKTEKKRMPKQYRDEKHASNHVFDIEFTCDECEEVQHINEKISDILSELSDSGWPICPECGHDMEFSVVE